MTSTNGASSSSTSAWRNGLRNSSPPSVGESTLLCRCTLGSPGIAPSRTSSMPGWPAAVIDTLSPSQLIPSEIQRMWTSSTPGPIGSGVISAPSVRQHRLLELERVDEQLLAAHQLEVQRSRTPRTPAGSPATRSRSRSAGSGRRRGRPPAPARRPPARCPPPRARRRSRGRRARPGAGARPARRRGRRAARPRAAVPAIAIASSRSRPRRSRAASSHPGMRHSRSSAGGRRRAGPSPACRRTRSRRAPCPGARS